ncbi:MAG TPA: hypothetical protein VF214_01510, partial [Edaphobacter sp.]
GHTFAFVRERKGRGSAWIAHFNAGPPSRLTDDSYDVRAVAFLRSGSLLFLAKHNGRGALFTVNPGAPPLPFFDSGGMEAFAASPDEYLIAFTQLIHNHWQLATLDTLSHRVTVLTSADCNAYTPAWLNSTTIIYATDCGRGIGLTALASMNIARQINSGLH